MNHTRTELSSPRSAQSKDQMRDLFPNDCFRARFQPRHTLLSFNRPSSWVAGMIFRVMDPWDCA